MFPGGKNILRGARIQKLSLSLETKELAGTSSEIGDWHIRIKFVTLAKVTRLRKRVFGAFSAKYG